MDSRRSIRYSDFFGSVHSDASQRQETQIVQSRLTLDDFMRAPWKGAPS